jgi:hypothetical protein
VVVVRDVDRLTQKQSDWSRFEKATVEHRVLLTACVGGDLDLSTPEGAYYGGMETLRRNGESAVKCVRARASSAAASRMVPVREMPRCIIVPSVRPAVRVRALSADAREGRDGTTLGMITQSDRSSAVRGRRRSSRRAPFPHSGEAGGLGVTQPSRAPSGGYRKS